MSADDIPDDTTGQTGDQTGDQIGRTPKDRLKAMQARHVSVQPAGATPEPASATDALTGDQMGAPTGAGLMADLQAAMAGGQGAAGGRPAIMQKLRQVLSGPDGRIDPQRARMALMFVRKQASDPAAPRHDLAKRIEGMVRNMPPQQRQRLLAAAGMSGGMAAGKGGGFGAGPKNRPGPRGLGGAGAGNAGNANAGQGEGGAGEGEAGEGGSGQGGAWFENFLDKI